jgi:hypothetical protein
MDAFDKFKIFAFLVFAFGLVCGVVGCSTLSFGRGYSDGSRTGTVIKLSKKGLLDGCKSYEGEMLLAGAILMPMRQDGGKSPAIYNFTIKDEEVAKKVSALSASGKPVTLRYIQWVNTSACWGDTNYEVVDVSASEGK